MFFVNFCALKFAFLDLLLNIGNYYPIYHNNSFAMWFCIILAWFMPIFMPRIPESGFLSGCPVFQKVHIWNLVHVIWSFQSQNFLETNIFWVQVLLGNNGFWFLNISKGSSNLIYCFWVREYYSLFRLVFFML